MRAYLGHRAFAVNNTAERNAITRILKDELLHRRCILKMLDQVGSSPDPKAEKKLDRVGRFITLICRFGGWYIPMYGAARLEADNIVEYEIAARLAWHAGLRDWIDDLLEMAEVEWDHEHVLRGFASSHWLWRFSPKWPVPALREQIRASFDAWTRSPTDVERRKAWLVR